MLMDGIFAAVTTPFYPDERVYYRKLEANIARYSRSLLAGMLVLGSTGEAALIDYDESADILRCAASAAQPEKVLIAGVGRESLRATLALAETAATAGYDAILVRPPGYYRSLMTPGVLTTYFQTVADHSPLPVLLYNIPQCTGTDLDVETVAALASHPNIIGIKDSMGRLERIQQLIAATATVPRRQVSVTQVLQAVTGRMQTTKNSPDQNSALVQVSQLTGGAAQPPQTQTIEIRTRTKEVGFQVLCGSGSIALEALDAGATGAILAFAAFAPEACTEIYLARKDNDPNLARERQQRIKEPNHCIVVQAGIAAIKYACDFNGYYGGYARRPLSGLTAELRAEIEGKLAMTRN